MEEKFDKVLKEIHSLLSGLDLDRLVVGREVSNPGVLFELKVIEKLLQVCDALPSFARGGQYIARSIAQHPETNNYIFGPGYHSTMAMIEATYRAAGLACFIPIVYQGMNIEVGGLQSTRNERTPNIVKRLFAEYCVREEDTLVLNNQYGINQMTIEAAKEAIKRDVYVVAMTSRDYGDQLPAQHEARYTDPGDGSQGVTLFELVMNYERGVYCECGTPYRDGLLMDVALGGDNPTNKVIAPFSTIGIGNAHSLLVAYTIKALRDLGYPDIEDVVVQSANTVGGADQNRVVQQKWPWQFRSPEKNKAALQEARK